MRRFLRLLVALITFSLWGELSHATEQTQSVRQFNLMAEDIVAWQEEFTEKAGETKSVIKFTLTEAGVENIRKATTALPPYFNGNNLVILYNNVEIAAVKVFEPITSNGFVIDISPDQVAKLKMILPQNHAVLP